MKKLLLITGIALMLFGCKKKSEPDYNVYMTVWGPGTYHYQIGQTVGDGHVGNEEKVITGTAHTFSSDLILLRAHADTLGQNISIDFKSLDTPFPTNTTYYKNSPDPELRLQLEKN